MASPGRQLPGWEDLVQPLDGFYAAAGLPMPALERVDGDAIPEPLRQLLVHCHDMTPTLESFYGRNIHLRVLNRRREGQEYRREVVLHLDGTDEPVEFGANRIYLDRFPEAAVRLILEEREPLGHILRDFNVTHTCHPNAFLRVASDRVISDALRLRGVQVLFGRHNRLHDPEGRLISEVVEILRTPGAPGPG
jgi:chorismate-pyruvate lyase